MPGKCYLTGRNSPRSHTPKRSSLLKTARPFCNVPQRCRKGEVVSGRTQSPPRSCTGAALLRPKSARRDATNDASPSDPRLSLFLHFVSSLLHSLREPVATHHSLVTVVGHHPHHLPIFDLHKLPRLLPILIRVIQHHTRQTPHHVRQLKLQIRIRREPLRKIGPQRRLPAHIPRRIIQQSRRDR